MHGLSVRLIKESTSDSNFARVKDRFKCFGPLASAVINGKMISVCFDEDN